MRPSTDGSSHTPMAAVWGTSVPSSASMIRHSRMMPLSRSAGAVAGGIRITQWMPSRVSS